MSRISDPDDDVLAFLDRGDTGAALQLLMQRHGNAVYRYCRTALGDAALADDVHQQIFMQVFRDLARFRRGSAVRTWVFAIARNRVLDAAKARRRRHQQLEAARPADLPELGPAPGEAIDAERLRQILVACLRELDDRTRTAVLLHYQQGFTFAEMAAICGERAGTLCTRVARALRMLRARIESRVRDGPDAAAIAVPLLS
jgi:RNA polymerase sigma-70 factor (ECF subfamily)